MADSKVAERRCTTKSAWALRHCAILEQSSTAMACALSDRSASASINSRSCSSAFGFESPGCNLCSCADRFASNSAQVATVAACASRVPCRNSVMARAVSSPKSMSGKRSSVSSRSLSAHSRRPRAASRRATRAVSCISAKNFVMKSGTVALKVSCESFWASVITDLMTPSQVSALNTSPRTISKQPWRRPCSAETTALVASSPATSAGQSTSASLRTRMTGRFASL
mmetsp:Transcript_15810/g.43704  ORF Transcript_15810/g.43704 Transcript_15810/m.43704 type:complete len:227 (-) Transcript_15810:32-712(-)